MTRLAELLRHLEGDEAAERPAAEVVRPFGLRRADRLDVAGGHVLEAGVGGLLAVESGGLEGVEGAVGAELAGELVEAVDDPAGRVDAEEGPSCPLALEGHEGRPGARGLGRPQQGGQLLDRRSQEQRREWQAAAELLLDPGQQADRQQRVAAEVKEALADADRPDAQDFFPDRDEPALRWRREAGDAARAAPAAADPGRAAQTAVDLAGGGQRQGAPGA